MATLTVKLACYALCLASVFLISACKFNAPVEKTQVVQTIDDPESGADPVEDDGLVFFLDTINRINEEDGSSGGSDLHEKLLQGRTRESLRGRVADPAGAFELFGFEEEDRPAF